MNSGLNENETELGVLVLAVALKVLSDGNSLVYGLADCCDRRKKSVGLAYLLDKHVQILGELGGEACKISLSVSTAQRH